jgi:hypothetical protein
MRNTLEQTVPVLASRAIRQVATSGDPAQRVIHALQNPAACKISGDFAASAVTKLGAIAINQATIVVVDLMEIGKRKERQDS